MPDKATTKLASKIRQVKYYEIFEFLAWIKSCCFRFWFLKLFFVKMWFCVKSFYDVWKNQNFIFYCARLLKGGIRKIV